MTQNYLSINESPLEGWGRSAYSLLRSNDNWTRLNEDEKRLFLSVFKSLYEGRHLDAVSFCDQLSNSSGKIVGAGYARMWALRQLGDENGAMAALIDELKTHPEYHEARVAWNSMFNRGDHHLPMLLNTQNRCPNETWSKLQPVPGACAREFDSTSLHAVIAKLLPTRVLVLGEVDSWIGNEVRRVNSSREGMPIKQPFFLSSHQAADRESWPARYDGSERTLYLADLCGHANNMSHLLQRISEDAGPSDYAGFQFDFRAGKLSRARTQFEELWEFLYQRPGDFEIDGIVLDGHLGESSLPKLFFVRRARWQISPELDKEVVRGFIESDPVQFDIETRLSINERFQLYYALFTECERLESCTIIEVGSWAGGSMKIMLDACKAQDCRTKFVSIDPSVQKDFSRVSELFGSESVMQIALDSARATSIVGSLELTGPIHVLFVDGDHSYEWVSHDLNAYVPLVAPGGLIIVHDYLEDDFVEHPEELFALTGSCDWGIGRACDEVLIGKYGCKLESLPLLYPDNREQSRSEIPPISSARTTLRAFRKPCGAS